MKRRVCRWRQRVTRLRLCCVFAGQTRSNGFDPLLQLREMRSRQVNLPATAAASELLIIYPGQRLELIKDFGFLCRFKRGVAAEAASKWSQSEAQIESDRKSVV